MKASRKRSLGDDEDEVELVLVSRRSSMECGEADEGAASEIFMNSSSSAWAVMVGAAAPPGSGSRGPLGSTPD